MVNMTLLCIYGTLSLLVSCTSTILSTFIYIVLEAQHSEMCFILWWAAVAAVRLMSVKMKNVEATDRRSGEGNDIELVFRADDNERHAT